jgi:hypothetical protein
VAAAEQDATRAKLFRDMAAAKKQARILAKDLKPFPTFTPSLRSRITAGLLRVLPPRAMRHVLSASKVRGVSVYRGKVASSGGDFPGYAQYAELTKENAAHAHAPQDFGMWVLGSFATVDEVKDALKNTVMVPDAVPRPW